MSAVLIDRLSLCRMSCFVGCIGRENVGDFLMNSTSASIASPNVVVMSQGNLGAIDDKYDVAISTASDSLDFIVVDNMTTAMKGIEFLKKNNVGMATFIALDKMEKWKSHCDKTIKTFVGFLLGFVFNLQRSFAQRILLLPLRLYPSSGVAGMVLSIILPLCPVQYVLPL